MWRKTSSEKKRSESFATTSKLRASAAEDGNASSHSAVATRLYCARPSQTSQKPPIPDSHTKPSIATPVVHEKRRKCA